MKTLTVLAALLVLLSLLGCGEEKLPSRDEIPVLRSTLATLDTAIAGHNRAAIDSMRSVEILDEGQDSDSLMRLCFGPNGGFAFEHLGNYDIFYSRQMAVIDCFVMDSARKTDRPLKLYFKPDNKRWLLKKFEAGEWDTTTAE